MAEIITACRIKEEISENGSKVIASDRPIIVDNLVEGDVVKLIVSVNGKSTDIMSEVFTVPKITAGKIGRFAVHLTTYDEINPPEAPKEVSTEGL